jgi:hypothetical protein
MQSILGALLTAGYASAMSGLIAGVPNHEEITDTTQAQLVQSFAGAEGVAQQYPQYAQQIVAGAQQSFLDGANWAYVAGIAAVLLGAALVFFLFPKPQHERELLEEYAAEDASSGS